MAHERARGLSARSLARALSSVKSFIRWLAEREGFAPTHVLAARAPKYTRKLPRPLSEEAAMAVIDQVEVQEMEPWIAARGYAAVAPVPATGLFDSCWVEIWPVDPETATLLRTTVVADPSSEVQPAQKQLNSRLGATYDASAEFRERLTEPAPIAAAVSMTRCP